MSRDPYRHRSGGGMAKIHFQKFHNWSDAHLQFVPHQGRILCVEMKLCKIMPFDSLSMDKIGEEICKCCITIHFQCLKCFPHAYVGCCLECDKPN